MLRNTKIFSTYSYFKKSTVDLVWGDARKALVYEQTCDFQQCGILTIVESGKPVQPPFKPRNSKCRLAPVLKTIFHQYL